MENEKNKDLFRAFCIASFGFLILYATNLLFNLFTDENNIGILKKIFTLDAYWYNSIIDDGYMKYTFDDPNNKIFVRLGTNGMANWAFFPLLPLIIKFLKMITFNVISVEIISFMFSFTCNVFMIYNVIRYLRDKNITIKWLILFLIFYFNPVIMLFYTLYTESLTMLLIILLIRTCDKKNYLAGGFLCALLSFIKVQGCFWCIYLFSKIYQENKMKGKNLLSTFLITIKQIIKNPVSLLSICISPLGLFVFFVILNYNDLHILSFIHVQSSWGKENNFFLYTIFKSIFLEHDREALFALFFVIFTVYLLIKKKYLSCTMMFLYLISSTTSSVASVTRYMIGSVIFPLELYMYIVPKTELTVNHMQKIKKTVVLTVFYGYKFIIVPFMIFVFVMSGIPFLY